MQQLIDELAELPIDSSICEYIYIGVIDGNIDNVIIFIHDQIRLGHRDTLVGAIGEELVGKIERL